jgi:hypothetical protein
MTDRTDPYERIALGHAAQEALQSEVIKLAIDSLIAEYENAWRNSPFDAADIRELAYRRRGALVDVKAELEKLVEDGLAAEQELKQAEQDATGKGQVV